MVAVLIAAAMASRALMPVVMLLQPSARADGPRRQRPAARAGAGDDRQLFIAIGATAGLLPLTTPSRRW